MRTQVIFAKRHHKLYIIYKYNFNLKKMKKAILGLLLLIVIVGGVYAYNENKTPQQMQKVIVAQTSEFFLYAPLYLAQDNGYFEDEGIEVNIVTAGGDEKAFASLLSGDAQFAVGDPTFVAISGEKGQPGKVIAALLTGVPFWGVAKTDVPKVTDPSMLKGYSVATFPSPSTAYALQTKMFQSGNLKPDIRQVAFGALLPALEANQVDIALELEPNVSTSVKNGNHIVFALSTYYPDFAITGVTALPDYLKNNPEIAQKFVNALRRADLFIRDNPEEAARIVGLRFTDIDKEVAISAMKNTVEANVIPQSMVITKNGWDSAVQLRRDVGDIKNPAPYETYIDTSFAEKADKIK